MSCLSGCAVGSCTVTVIAGSRTITVIEPGDGFSKTSATPGRQAGTLTEGVLVWWSVAYLIA